MDLHTYFNNSEEAPRGHQGCELRPAADGPAASQVTGRPTVFTAPAKWVFSRVVPRVGANPFHGPPCGGEPIPTAPHVGAKPFPRPPTWGRSHSPAPTWRPSHSPAPHVGAKPFPGPQLAMRPKVLLLDEPASGIPAGESTEVFGVIAALPSDVTVLFIEHDMELVFRFAQRIAVLVDGRLLTEGTPAEVAADQRVRDVYLGEAQPGEAQPGEAQPGEAQPGEAR